MIKKYKADKSKVSLFNFMCFFEILCERESKKVKQRVVLLFRVVARSSCQQEEFQLLPRAPLGLKELLLGLFQLFQNRPNTPHPLLPLPPHPQWSRMVRRVSGWLSVGEPGCQLHTNHAGIRCGNKSGYYKSDNKHRYMITI